MISFLKKNIILILTITFVLLTFILKKLKPKQNLDDKNLSSNLILQNISLSQERKEFLNTSALKIAHHLGTAYTLFDPRYYTENDKEVYDIMVSLSKSDYDTVSLLYFQVYAKGRTLSVDLAKMLDSKYYQQLINI